MKRMLLIFSLLCVAGCGWGDYHARDWWGLGYEEAETEPGVYLVQYTSDRNSLGEIVEFWKKRSLEICQAKGKTGYDILSAGLSTSNAGYAGMASPVSPTLAVGYASAVQYRHYAGTIRCKEGTR